MVSAPVWPQPAINKLQGLNLPIEVELSFVDEVVRRCLKHPGNCLSFSVVFEKSALGLEGEVYEYFGWAHVESRTGGWVIVDFGCDMLD